MKNCVIYGLTSNDYIPLVVQSINTLHTKGRYSGPFLINVIEGVGLEATRELCLFNVIINVIKLDTSNYNELFYAKYDISKSDADNFLYIDADITALDDINPLFDIIHKTPNEFSCVQEFTKIPKWANHYHWKDNEGHIASLNSPGMNGGTFGFTRERLDLLNKIMQSRNKDFLANSDTDQPIFNKILQETGAYNTNLTDYVHLLSNEEQSKNDKNVLRHFNGPKAHIMDTEKKLKLML